MSFQDNFRKIAPYIPGEQSREAGIIKLNANENPYPPSPKALQALKNFNAETLRLYPPADAAPLKDAIAKRYGVQRENVFLGNGSDDVIALAFQAFFNSDKPIVFPDITYSFYPVWCELLKIPFQTYPLDAQFRINPEDYKAGNGGVVFPNPNAPTSLYENHAFIQKIMTYNQDCVVIVDEAYVDFGGESAVPLTKEYENLLITGTFSKSRSLAGLRLGFAIGNAALIRVLETVKNSYNSYTVDTLSIAMGIASIEDEAYFQETVGKIMQTRKAVMAALQQFGFEVLPSATNFLMATHSQYDMQALFTYLKQKKIYIRYFSQPRIDKYVRISIGTPEEMTQFLEEVKHFIQEKSL